MISLNTKTLSQQLSFLFPTTIYVDSSLTKLPCEIVKIEFNSEYNIPTEVIEGNEYVSDNIARKPNGIQVEVYVHDDKITSFYNVINETQYNDVGFTLVDRNSIEYPNLRIVNLSNIQQTESAGCEFFTIEFMEMNSVSPLKIQGYSLKTPAPLSPVVDAGSKNAERVSFFGGIAKEFENFTTQLKDFFSQQGSWLKEIGKKIL